MKPTKVCPKCKVEKPRTPEFWYTHSRNQKKVTAYCKPCHLKWSKEKRRIAREKNPAWAERVRESDRLRERPKERMHHLSRYGLNRRGYAAMLASQDGVCAVCRQLCITGRNLAVDHNHSTGMNRGLLCQRCNTAIGQLRDDPALCRAAATYLELHA